MLTNKIYSMTGFGKGERNIASGKLMVEIKSVNNRFLDIQVRGLSLTAETERAVCKIIRENVGRGSISVMFTMIDEKGSIGGALPVINVDVLKNYYNVCKEVSAVFNEGESITITSLLSLPEVISTANKSPLSESFAETIIEVLKEAICSLNEMREKEGVSLANDVIMRIKRIRSLAADASSCVPSRIEAYKKRIEDRAAEVFKEGLDEFLRSRLMMEVTLMADKIDVSEEITRLLSHCSQMEEAIKTGGAVGKKLNFVQQEIVREANTLSSKSQDTDLLRHAIAIKEESESIKEQIQNIE